MSDTMTAEGAAGELADAPAGSGASDQRFLTFRIGGRRYALPAGEVSKIIRVPVAARVPQGPKCLLGLANLRGTVLPLISLRMLLEQAGSDAGEAARAIVLTGAHPLALAVDAVEALVFLPPGGIDTSPALVAAPGEILRGAFAGGADQEVIRILDVTGMLGVAFGRETRRTPHPAAHAATLAHALAVDDAQDDRQALVTFDVAGQEYALALDAVREIVPVPAAITVAPRAEAVLLGVIAYRDTLLPLLSLRGLLGFPVAAALEDAAKVVVIVIGGVQVGLVADRMRAILRADPALIDPAPSMLAARTGGEARIKAIFRGEGGRRLVSLLAPEHLFRDDVMQRLNDRISASVPPTAEPAPAETAQFLIFRLGDDEFGLPIAAVDEVAQVPDRITRVPRTPKFLEGVVNLRGEILPVVDQRRRFDMLPLTDGDKRRLVVVRTQRHRAGLIVDSVSEVLRAPTEAIAPPPELTEDISRLVSGVLNLPATDRIVLLLDPAELLSRAERGLLDAFTARTAGQVAM